jgi:hypothetical protein
MKVVTSKSLPSTQELAVIIQTEFSGRYTCKLFGIGQHKTIMVRQSPFSGAQISLRANEITIQGVPSPVLAIMSLTELAAVLVFCLGWVLSAPWKKLEKEIAVFLHKKYQ